MAKKTRVAGRRRSGRSLTVLSTIELRAELRRREGKVGRLIAKHRSLSKQIAGIEAELAAFDALPGSPSRRPGRPAGTRKRHRNDTNLEQALAKVLKGKTMGVNEVAAAVQDAGYKTTSPNFRTIVNQTLIRSNLIKKIARGKYTAA